MATKDIPSIGYDPTHVFLDVNGLSEPDLSGIGPSLLEARREVLETDRALYRGAGEIPPQKRPLDAGFFEFPQQLLADYQDRRQASQLGRILDIAQRLRETVDRVVVLGIGGSYMGARALFEACCHPYHNELSRGERGGRPRIYFQGNNVDNDATQGLLDLFAPVPAVAGVDDAWATIVISKSGGTLETAVAFRKCIEALRTSTGGDADLAASRLFPITGEGSKLHRLCQAFGCHDFLPVPDGVGGRFSILTAVGLLPAAVMGLDVVRLLEGAAAMNEHFRSATPADNVVLQYVGVCHLMEKLRGATTRILSVWSSGLEAVGLWYDQLLAESLGKQLRGALPLTAVNTRDLHSRGQQHQEGPRDKLITNLIVDAYRRDPVVVGQSDFDQDGLNRIGDKTLPEIMSAAIEGTNRAYGEDARPTADLRLPAVDEESLGQLFQMLMIATVVEGRLIGINPYGQPGVEGYKTHMQSILGLR